MTNVTESLPQVYQIERSSKIVLQATKWRSSKNKHNMPELDLQSSRKQSFCNILIATTIYTKNLTAHLIL